MIVTPLDRMSGGLMLTKLGTLVLRHRKIVVGIWLVLTAFGAFAAPRATNRFLTTFSIPGSASYQANQQIVKTFGNGDQPPLVLVFHDSTRDVTAAPGLQRAIAAALRVNPGARVSSYFNTHSGAYVSADRHTTFAELYPV